VERARNVRGAIRGRIANIDKQALFLVEIFLGFVDLHLGNIRHRSDSFWQLLHKSCEQRPFIAAVIFSTIFPAIPHFIR
jgi:hypothetical protein